MQGYNHHEIEKKWQDMWEHERAHETPDHHPSKENKFILTEFCYPSGNLHVGHWYAFGVTDIYARYQHMRGYNVLFPVGFDSFGLPAENAAIKNGGDPRTWTYANIEKMRGQLRSIGARFDWSREIITSDPEYYRWTQWMFAEFFKKGIAYRGSAMVNWDPVDKTVIANEQVLPDGTSERSGALVERKEMSQWMLRITDYADQLDDDLESLDWPEDIKASQRAWIGRSKGAEIDFIVTAASGVHPITIFTTRPDTLYGVTYVVLAPEHPLVETLLEHVTNNQEVRAYQESVRSRSDLERQQSKEKTGVPLVGIYAQNPINGIQIPVWIADYVLPDYGTGAVMAVPAHDERDFAFAQKYELSIQMVIDSPIEAVPYTEHGTLIHSDEFSGMHSQEAQDAMVAKAGGKRTTTYRIRDWGMSRQRYWGCPIPIVYDPEGVPHAIPAEHLPWTLPDDVDHTPDGTAPLARSRELHERTERIFGAGWTPEVETMDTFVDSSWYFYRYLDAHNQETFCASDAMHAWMPADMYMGGAEHTTMHVLYSRFFNKALHALGHVPHPEPYTVRRNRGLILGTDGNKMSKSKGNVIDPDEQVHYVGADSVRMYLAFLGPFGVTHNYPWDTNGLVGMRRFIEKVWRLSEKIQPSDNLAPLVHTTIRDITHDMERFKFNTALSKMMILVNAAEKEGGIARHHFEILVQLLAPFAPHAAEELWRGLLDHDSSVHNEAWPLYDETLMATEEYMLPVQINGKVRAQITVPTTITEEEVLALARQHETLAQWTDGKDIKKVIFVQGKILNIVI
ncbi:MAG: leucine--tRNA ligase [Candidatus Pacebacteria bacterium]|nr:leucine--tRNA ligase [Candidatus Paceibacterota bacterium]MCD8507794.1 leucine--tRNA ligase [Candidatus Paceibacterota bacterium]MCD8527887.1 leucine--tRNA ligase [Candidatus Paceibacterota bacterium]MCD8563561.1 leucine--tRNA ligase [Candidatus Paceibacterota bacterium]